MFLPRTRFSLVIALVYAAACGGWSGEGRADPEERGRSTGSLAAEDAVMGAAMQRTPGQIKFDDLSHDFGTILRGEKVNFQFRFKNVGKGPLVVQGVDASCGCTAAETERGRKYQPNEGGVIDVTFDSTDFIGKVSKTVNVMTNEHHLPDRTLTLRAQVSAEFEANPPLVDFGEVFARDGAAQQITIRVAQGVKFEISRLKYNQEALDVGYRKEGANWLINVKVKPSIQTGFFKDTILVVSNSKALKELPIPVRATVKGNIDFAPRYIEFGAISKAAKANRSITLSGITDFEILSTRSEININGGKIAEGEPLIQVNMLPHEKNKQLISVDLHNKASKAGSVHGKLYLETTDPQQKQVVVDFYAFFR